MTCVQRQYKQMFRNTWFSSQNLSRMMKGTVTVKNNQVSGCHYKSFPLIDKSSV